MCFEVVSSLKINMEKSELIPMELGETVEKLALSFGFTTISFPQYIWVCIWELLQNLLFFWNLVKTRSKKYWPLGRSFYLSNSGKLFCFFFLNCPY